jgi:hypothetical protein
MSDALIDPAQVRFVQISAEKTAARSSPRRCGWKNGGWTSERE